MKKIFLISPVANASADDKSREQQRRIAAYVALKEAEGYKVHWPIRDTEQKDKTGGYEICYTNARAIQEAEEIHIWYDETSGGSKFDMGVAFTYIEMLKIKKRVVIANKDYICDKEKSFYKVFQRLVD